MSTPTTLEAYSKNVPAATLGFFFLFLQQTTFRILPARAAEDSREKQKSSPAEFMRHERGD